MNIEDIREYCLKKKAVTEDFPFGIDYLTFRVGGKIFAGIPLEKPGVVQLKCNPEYAIELRDRYTCIVGAWHWNKKYWNEFTLDGGLSDKLICSLLDHAYDETVKKLTRKQRQELGI